MTFEYRDHDGDSLHVAPLGSPDEALIGLAIETRAAVNAVHIPLARVEEVIAGIRDAARQANPKPTGVPCGVCGNPWTDTHGYSGDCQTTGQIDCACTHPQDRHLSACTECPCIGYAPTWPPTKHRIVPVCNPCGAPWTTDHTCADPTTADDPTPLRWGLNDVLWGDDDTVIVCMSGPDREPYWLELDAERAAALRDDLAVPTEPQDHPGADLYVRLRKAGEDHDTAQALIYAHARMAIREHVAIHGPAPVVGQPAATPNTNARQRAYDNLYAELTRGVSHAQVRHHLIEEHRAAVLREAADEAERENAHCPPLTVSPCQPCAVRTAIAAHLRRTADEETQR